MAGNVAATAGAADRETRRLWPSLALITLPVAALIGLEVYHTIDVQPDLARSQAAVSHTFAVMMAPGCSAS